MFLAKYLTLYNKDVLRLLWDSYNLRGLMVVQPTSGWSCHSIPIIVPSWDESSQMRMKSWSLPINYRGFNCISSPLRDSKPVLVIWSDSSPVFWPTSRSWPTLLGPQPWFPEKACSRDCGGRDAAFAVAPETPQAVQRRAAEMVVSHNLVVKGPLYWDMSQVGIMIPKKNWETPKILETTQQHITSREDEANPAVLKLILQIPIGLPSLSKSTSSFHHQAPQLPHTFSP